MWFWRNVWVKKFIVKQNTSQMFWCWMWKGYGSAAFEVSVQIKKEFLSQKYQCFLVIQYGGCVVRHRSHHFATQSSHFVDRAGWQAKMASIEFWIPWRNAHGPHSSLVSRRIDHTRISPLSQTFYLWIIFLSWTKINASSICPIHFLRIYKKRLKSRDVVEKVQNR